MVVVICVEGIHGVGKSFFLNKLRQEGRHVLDEEFMNTVMKDYSPTGMVRQVVWLADWIQRVVKAAAETQPLDLIYVDRSMYSAIMYNDRENETNAMKLLIDKSIQELKVMGIQINTVLFTDETHDAWNRIQERLLKEPQRKQFNEHSETHYYKVWDKYYKTHANIWDMTMKAPKEFHTEQMAIQHFDQIVQTLTDNSGR